MKSFLKKLGLERKEQKTYFDVVCGVELSLSKAKHASEFRSETYYFCSQSCKNHFDGDPVKYAGS